MTANEAFHDQASPYDGAKWPMLFLEVPEGRRKMNSQSLPPQSSRESAARAGGIKIEKASKLVLSAAILLSHIYLNGLSMPTQREPTYFLKT